MACSGQDTCVCVSAGSETLDDGAAERAAQDGWIFGLPV